MQLAPSQVGVAGRIGIAQRAVDAGVLGLGEVIEDFASLVRLAALDDAVPKVCVMARRSALLPSITGTG